MKKRYLFPVICLFFIISCKDANNKSSDVFIIHNISVIDPISGLNENQDVHISEGRIVKIEHSKNLEPEVGGYDGSGKYLIPGLWDAHVHFAFAQDLAPRMLDLFLAYGITSVRDTGGDIDFVNKWKNKALENPTSSPRVMVAGPLIDGYPNVYDGSDSMHPPLSIAIQSNSDVQTQIEALNGKNVDFLKAYEMLTPEQFELVMSQAKKLGLKVTGHVPLSMDVITASNLGLNSMEHMRNLELSCASNSDQLLEERKKMLEIGNKQKGGVLRTRIHQAQRQNAIQKYDEVKAEKVLQALKDNETWQIPTLALNVAGIYQPFKQDNFQASFQYLPDTIEQRWRKEIARISPPATAGFQYDYAKWKLQMVKKIYDKGIPIMAGTDCPIYYLTPGRSLHQELVELERAGIPALDILATATINPAKYFGLEKDLGTISEGKLADLLILGKNPLERIKNTMEIEAVIKQGKMFDRKDLDELFNQLNNN